MTISRLYVDGDVPPAMWMIARVHTFNSTIPTSTGDLARRFVRAGYQAVAIDEGVFGALVPSSDWIDPGENGMFACVFHPGERAGDDVATIFERAIPEDWECALEIVRTDGTDAHQTALAELAALHGAGDVVSGLGSILKRLVDGLQHLAPTLPWIAAGVAVWLVVHGKER